MSAPLLEQCPWGQAPDGTPLTLFTLRSPGGVQVDLMNHGAVITRILAPDRTGTLADVVLGHDHPAGYFSHATSPYFGAVVGRYANRLAGGHFTLDGRAYHLATNNGPNALHGGERGFDGRVWQADALTTPQGPAVRLTYRSPDGEEGYPGTLDVTVTYTLTPGNVLRVEYAARTDAPTILNLTQHTYWNLSGDPTRDVLGHLLTVHADAFTPVDETLIPTGELRPVAGTPFDFRAPRPVGRHLRDPDRQLKYAGGYDHNFVLRGAGLRLAAELHHPPSGRTLGVHTTEPGLQVYSGNFLDGRVAGKRGVCYARHAGLCLETQHFPDSPHHPHFPDTTIRPGELFTSRTEYHFSSLKGAGGMEAGDPPCGEVGENPGGTTWQTPQQRGKQDALRKMEGKQVSLR